MCGDLIREAAKRPMVTLQKLQSPTAQVDEAFNRTITSSGLCKSAFMEQCQETIVERSLWQDID